MLDFWRSFGRVARGMLGMALFWGACSAQAGLEDGKYGAAQVFDVQRSPAFPQAGQNFTVSAMGQPYSAVTSTRYTLGAGEYIRFIRVGAGDNPCSFEIRRYAADGTYLAQIAPGGTVYGLASEGFLHVSTPGGYGTFVANSAGYAYGQSTTFNTPIGAATCAQAADYAANDQPVQTPPPVLSSVSVLNVTAGGATLRGTSSAAGTGYWVVVPDGAAAPSAANVRAGQAAGGGSPVAQGSGPMSAGVAAGFAITGLAPGTPYHAYLVVDNGSALSALTGPRAFTTLAPVNGVCASISQPLTAAPAGAAACTAGTVANAASSASAFTWHCSGSDGGSTATSCSAPRGYTVTSTVSAGGSVTPSGAQVVAYGGTANLSLAASAGHVLSAASGCGGSLSGTLGTSTTASYATAPVTANCALSFGFAANARPTASVSIEGAAATQGVPLAGSYVYQDQDSDPEGATTVQWKRALAAAGLGTPIPGATGPQYTPTAEDAGTYLSFCVVPVAVSGLATGTEACAALSSPVRVDGVCGPAAAQASATTPAGGLCTSGAPGAVSVLGGAYAWSCQGQHGGADSASCQAGWSPTGAGPRGTVAKDPAAADGWQLVSAAFSGTPPAAAPEGMHFPAGLLALQLSSGTAGSSTRVTVRFTEPVPAGAVYMKYGPSPEGLGCTGAACAQPHWYAMPRAQAAFSSDRRSVTLTLQDGGVGDGDRLANSWIDDPGGPAVVTVDPQQIPTLSEWGMLLLSAAMGWCAVAVLRRRRA